MWELFILQGLGASVGTWRESCSRATLGGVLRGAACYDGRRATRAMCYAGGVLGGASLAHACDTAHNSTRRIGNSLCAPPLFPSLMLLVHFFSDYANLNTSPSFCKGDSSSVFRECRVPFAFETTGLLHLNETLNHPSWPSASKNRLFSFNDSLDGVDCRLKNAPINFK